MVKVFPNPCELLCQDRLLAFEECAFVKEPNGFEGFCANQHARTNGPETADRLGQIPIAVLVNLPSHVPSDRKEKIKAYSRQVGTPVGSLDKSSWKNHPRTDGARVVVLPGESHEFRDGDFVGQSNIWIDNQHERGVLAVQSPLYAEVVPTGIATIKWSGNDFD